MSGFIPGSRGSIMLDIVVVAMFLILPVVFLGIYFVKNKFSYAVHKTLMMTVSAILGFAVILFEIEMRLSGWKHLAEKSPYYETYVPLSLGIHLFFSISTSVALLSTVVLALKNFSKRPKPNAHSQLHKKLGWISTLGLVGTSITGWIFYYLAFVAD